MRKDAAVSALEETGLRCGDSLFSGRVAIVTGGASGIGASSVRALAGAGATVVVVDIDKLGSQSLAAEITAAGGTAIAMHCDVTSPEEIEYVVGATADRFGRLDCAVNGAALGPDMRPVSELDPCEFGAIMSVDVQGMALCMKYELRQMQRQGISGSIVNIASIRGVRARLNGVAYTAAKHAVIGMTKVAALEAGRRGVRVNAVGPGSTDTPMLRSALESNGDSVEDYGRRTSVFGRVGRPDEIANAIVWLCSDDSSYVTGSVLMVDGGTAVM